MGAPVASGTLAGSTSGSGPSIHREAARSDNTCSVDTLRSYDSHNSADHREVERRRRTRLPRKMKREDRRHQCGEIRPYRERGPAPSAWRLRRASDGQVRLQVAADRSASKHGGGSCNGPQSEPAGRSRPRTGRSTTRTDSRLARRRARPELGRDTCFGGMTLLRRTVMRLDSFRTRKQRERLRMITATVRAARASLWV